MIKNVLAKFPRALGFLPDLYPVDYSLEQIAIIDAVQPYTLTSHERIVSLVEAVRYIIHNNIPGAFAECGVWRGGSMMAVALTLCQLGCTDRELYLFDTFTGMASPAERDTDLHGLPALHIYRRFRRPVSDPAGSTWCYVPIDEVRHAMYRTGYPAAKLHFVQGLVEETLPAQAPPELALLRLDTDWYQSTHHELVHLYPRLARGGVLLVDDYGHWKGSQQATDDYLAEHGISLLLQRIDYTGRIGVKQ